MTDLLRDPASSGFSAASLSALGNLGSRSGLVSDTNPLLANSDSLLTETFSEVFALTAPVDTTSDATAREIDSRPERSESTVPISDADRSDTREDSAVDDPEAVNDQADLENAAVVAPVDRTSFELTVDTETATSVDVEVETTNTDPSGLTTTETTETIDTGPAVVNPDIDFTEQSVVSESEPEQVAVAANPSAQTTISPVSEDTVVDSALSGSTVPVETAAEVNQADVSQHQADDGEPNDRRSDQPRNRETPAFGRSFGSRVSQSLNQPAASSPAQPVAQASSQSAVSAQAPITVDPSVQLSTPEVASAALADRAVAALAGSAGAGNQTQSGLGGGAQRSAQPATAARENSGLQSSVASPSSQSNAPAASSTKRTSQPSQTDSLARIKLVQRVSRAFQHLGADGGSVRLRLSPGELGSIQVEVQIRQQRVNARVVAETEAAEAALREQLPDLRTRLESFGLQVERLEVSRESDQGQSAPFQNPFDRSGDEQPASGQDSPSRQPDAAAPAGSTATDDRVSQTPGVTLASVSDGVDLQA